METATTTAVSKARSRRRGRLPKVWLKLADIVQVPSSSCVVLSLYANGDTNVVRVNIQRAPKIIMIVREGK